MMDKSIAGVTVTVITNDFYFFQGNIISECADRGSSKEEFILLQLTCIPTTFIISGAVTIFVAVPVYTVGTIVKINVDKIISIAPSSLCLETPLEDNGA